MWGLPLFDQRDPDAVMWELDQLLKSKPASEGYYIKLLAFDNSRGIESCVSSFIVSRPEDETHFSVANRFGGSREADAALHTADRDYDFV